MSLHHGFLCHRLAETLLLEYMFFARCRGRHQAQQSKCEEHDCLHKTDSVGPGRPQRSAQQDGPGGAENDRTGKAN